MNQTVVVLLSMLAGAAMVAAGVLVGVVVAGRPARVTERRLDRALAISEAERSQTLRLLLAKDPATLAVLQATAPAQPPPVDQTLGGPPEPPAPWEAVAGQFTDDPNELTEWGAEDDAAFGRLGH